MAGHRHNRSLDRPNGRLGFVYPAVRKEPARTLGNESAKINDRDADDRTDAETEAPSEPVRNDSGIQDHERRRRSHRSSQPETAIDDQIDTAAQTRRDQLIDRGVDGGILTADSGSRDETKDGEGREIPGDRGEA